MAGVIGTYIEPADVAACVADVAAKLQGVHLEPMECVSWEVDACGPGVGGITLPINIDRAAKSEAVGVSVPAVGQLVEIPEGVAEKLPAELIKCRVIKIAWQRKF